MEVPKKTLYVTPLNQQKCPFLFPFFCKIGDQEGGTGPAWWKEGIDASGMGEEVGQVCKRVTMCKYCVHLNVNGKKRYLLKPFHE
jgi:hypothetical protein